MPEVAVMNGLTVADGVILRHRVTEGIESLANDRHEQQTYSIGL